MFSGFSRRQILKLVSASVAGAAAVASIPLIGKLFVGKAQAQDASAAAQPELAAAENTTSYKGNTISVTNNTNNAAQTAQRAQVDQVAATAYDVPLHLSINGNTVDVIRNKKSGKYRSYYVPFKEYDSLQDLAKDVIETQALGAGKTKN